MKLREDVREFIRKNYADVAKKNSGGCCSGSSCCCGGDSGSITEISEKIGYSKEDILSVPEEANMGLGCGNPIAIAGLKQGEVVLDLGSGGGLDCFLARSKVGDLGYVIGVDMTPEMIKLARENAARSGYKNMDFRLGEIEHLPLEDNSVNVIISNCVINLALDKKQVFKEAFRVLKTKGRLAISDVVAIKELTVELKQDLTMTAGCIGGAEHIDELKAMLHEAGFKDIKMIPKENSKDIINSWVPGKSLDEYVASYIIEAVKS